MAKTLHTVGGNQARLDAHTEFRSRRARQRGRELVVHKAIGRVRFFIVEWGNYSLLLYLNLVG